MFQFCADQYECLEIFAKTQKGEKGSVSVRMLPDGEFLTQPAGKIPCRLAQVRPAAGCLL